jgi:DNA topoisomerase-1
MKVKVKEVIIAEKEEAARAIAEILWGSYQVETWIFLTNKVNFFKQNDSAVVPARGHLLRPKIKGITCAPWVKSILELPKTNIEWEAEKDSIPRLSLIKELCRDAERVIVATDYDREGEVIGYNILKHIGLNPDYRMYFSALTEEEVKNAYQNLVPMSESLLAQGLARNYADPIIGLNLTKALTLFYKSKFTHLTQAVSLGRVQSPLLEYICSETKVNQREEAYIDKIKGEVWEYYLDLNGAHYQISLDIDTDKKAIGEIEVLELIETESEVKQAEELFDTNTAISAMSIDPNAAMQGMESLYLKGYATYPRTKSTHVDEKIMEKLERAIRKYKDIPSEFSYKYTPEGKVEEKKEAIVLTEKGIDALFQGKIRGHQKLIAEVILNQMIKSMACPLIEVKRELRAMVNGVEKTIFWSNEIKNIELCIKEYISTERRPNIAPGKYPVISLRKERDREEVLSPIYRRHVKVHSDLDLVSWMTWNEIGTEATRATFPKELRDRNYTIENNLPTILGEEIGEIVRAIGIDLELTREMESRIERIQSLSQLDEFYSWVNELTDRFIKNIIASEKKINICCDEGHEAELVNTKNGLLIRCDKCNKFYRI